MTKNVQPTQALAKIDLDGGWLPQPKTIEEALALAEVFANSGMVPEHFKGEAAMVLVAIQKGSEIGLSPMFSLQNIAVIRGRPCLWGDAALALVKSDPRCDDVIETVHDDRHGKPIKGECTVLRRGKHPVTRTFSMADAVVADLASKKGPWQQYPRRMLQLRARGFALRDSFPDRLAGLPIAEEVRDYPDDMVYDAKLEPEAGRHSARTPKQETPATPPPENVDAEIESIIKAIGKAQKPAAMDKLAPRIEAIPNDRRASIRTAWVEQKKTLQRACDAPGDGQGTTEKPAEPKAPDEAAAAPGDAQSPPGDSGSGPAMSEKGADLLAAASATKNAGERIAVLGKISNSGIPDDEKEIVRQELGRLNGADSAKQPAKEGVGF